MHNQKELLEIAKTFFEADDLTLDTLREEVEGWDSLAHVMLISDVAENLGIKVPIEAFEDINCLKDILKYEK